MTDVIAKTRIKGKNYETLVDLDKALQFKKGQGEIEGVVIVGEIFHDSKKGLHVSESDLKDAFGTSEINGVVEKIIKQGEIQIPKEYRDQEREGKKKQIIDFLARHALDPRTGNPHTAERISSAIDEAGVSIDNNKSMEQQLFKVIEKIKEVFPIKIQSKKLKLRIPAEHTGRVYGLITDYKETENWLSNGDLEVIINLPVGLQDDFYDKLNDVTHGSVMSEEIKEDAGEG